MMQKFVALTSHRGLLYALTEEGKLFEIDVTDLLGKYTIRQILEIQPDRFRESP